MVVSGVRTSWATTDRKSSFSRVISASARTCAASRSSSWLRSTRAASSASMRTTATASSVKTGGRSAYTVRTPSCRSPLVMGADTMARMPERRYSSARSGASRSARPVTIGRCWANARPLIASPGAMGRSSPSGWRNCSAPAASSHRPTADPCAPVASRAAAAISAPMSCGSARRTISGARARAERMAGSCQPRCRMAGGAKPTKYATTAARLSTWEVTPIHSGGSAKARERPARAMTAAIRPEPSATACIRRCVPARVLAAACRKANDA